MGAQAPVWEPSSHLPDHFHPTHHLYLPPTPPPLLEFCSSQALILQGGWPMMPAPPFRPTKAQVSLQPRAGPAWLPKLLSRALAVSLRWKEPSSWETKESGQLDQHGSKRPGLM